MTIFLAAWMAAVAAVAVPDPTPVEEDPPGRTSLEFADHLQRVGEPHRAIQEYERFLFACGDCPDGAYAELQLAQAYQHAGRIDESARRLRALSARWPERPEGFMAAINLGPVLESAGEFGEAADAYRDVVVRVRERGTPTGYDPQATASGAALDAVRAALEARDPDRVRLGVDSAEGEPEFPGLVFAMESERVPQRSPLAAGLISAVLPGAGHVYGGRWREGVAAFVFNALFISAAAIAWDQEQYALAGALGGMELFWYGGNVVGAANAARRFNASAEAAHWNSLGERFLPAPRATLSFRF